MHWFIEYLITRPPAEMTGIKLRPRVVSWHDAAGASRWVAAVLRVKDVFPWSRIRTPQHLWQQLAPRDDEQIGFQELLGLVLLLGTFRSEIQGSSWVSFGDNDGITHAVEKGGRHNEECNMVIEKLWLQVAELDCDLQVASPRRTSPTVPRVTILAC